MDRASKPQRTTGAAVVGLMLVQGACAAFFLVDILNDYLEQPGGGWADWHHFIELLANIGLVAAILFEGTYLARLLKRQAEADRALSVASGALHDVMEGYFDDWGLTPSEADVARFAIKGFAIAEIAGLRGSAEGTVKTHLNAIYRKAGVPGRTQLVNLLIEELLGGPVVPPGTRTARPEPEPARTGARTSA